MDITLEREMADGSTPCEDHVWRWYRFLGVSRDGWNPITVLEIISLAFNTLWIIYMLLFTVMDDAKFVLHYLTLAYFYSGIFWTLLYKRPKIIRIARECDTFVGLTTPEDREQSVKIAQRLKQSKLYLGTNLMTAQVFNIAFINATRRIIMYVLFGAPRELMISGRDEDTLRFWLKYAVQATLLVTAGLCIAVNTQILYRICYHIAVKYRLLCYRLSRLKFDSNLTRDQQEAQLNKAIKDCIIHHQHILKIFNEFKDVCGFSFFFTYFGLFASIGLSRTSLVGDHPDYYSIPDFITESGYLFFQCYCLSDLPVENLKVKRSIYENDWMWYPRSTIQLLHTIGLWTSREPHVPLFPGGSPATCQSFGVLMNASMAYFMSALIF